jgi:hypothetical protein
MATKKNTPGPAKVNHASAVHTLKLGELVQILHSGGRRGRIVELRGPLGPGGVQIYRVLVQRRPKPAYIELREDQLQPLPAGT